MGKTLKLKNELQESLWKFIKTRTGEYIENNLSGRLVIDFRKGDITQVFDNAVIAGSTVVDFYLDENL